MSFDLPKYWNINKLDESLDILIDYRGKTPTKTKKGVPLITAKIVKNGSILTPTEFISPNDYESWMTRGMPQKGDILLTTEAPLGEVAQLQDEYVALAQRLILLRGKKDYLNNNYLLYLMQSNFIQNQLEARSSGSTVKGIKQRELRQIELLIPPYPTQQKIAKILGDLDKKIEINNQINETLESMAQAIFKSWFVDFDPVRAKAEAKAAGKDDTGILRAAMAVIASKSEQALAQMAQDSPDEYKKLEATAKAFPDAFVESELGLIPEGWELSTMGDELSLFGGGTPSTKNMEYWKYKDKDGNFTIDGDVNWSTPKDMSSLKDKVLLQTDRKITDAGLKTISSGLLPVNTVLMSSRAPVGYLALAKIPTAINQGFIAMVCDKNLTAEYVLQLVNFKMDEIKQRSSGTTFAEISRKNFNPIKILVPNECLLKDYTQQTKTYYKTIGHLIRENTVLVELRDSLLPKLLTGEIELKCEL